MKAAGPKTSCMSGGDASTRALAALLGTARTGAVADAVAGAVRLGGAASSSCWPPPAGGRAAAGDGVGRVVGLAALAAAALMPMGRWPAIPVIP